MGKHWLDGLWYFDDFKFAIHEIKGETAIWKTLAYFDYPDMDFNGTPGTIKYGSFGETSVEVKEVTGAEIYNVEIILWGGSLVRKGVVSEDGKTITGPHCMGAPQPVVGKWLDQEGLKALLDDREDIYNMTCPYPKNPENQGKLLWMSGPPGNFSQTNQLLLVHFSIHIFPGAGKSTTAQLFAKNHGFVYYEADCFMSQLNPYIPLDLPEPSMAQMNQKCVTGLSKEALMAVFKGVDELPKFAEGKCDPEVMKGWYTEMAKDILKEKKKIGGSWAVAQAISSREFRDVIRKILGDQCIFVILKLSEETNAARLESRHADMDEDTKKTMVDMLNGMHKMYEPAGEDEDSAVDVEIGPDMDRAAVVKAVLEKVQKYL